MSDNNEHSEYMYHYKKGLTDLYEKNYESALKDFEKAGSIWDNCYVYYGMGRAYYGLQEYLLALTYFETAYKLSQVHVNFQSTYWRAKTLEKLNRYDDADKTFQTLLSNILSINFEKRIVRSFNQSDLDQFHLKVINEYEKLKSQRINTTSRKSFGQKYPTKSESTSTSETSANICNNNHVSANQNSCVKDTQIDKLKQDIEDKYHEVVSEYQQFRERSERDAEIAIKLATKKIACDILEVVDNFERGIENEDENEIAGFIQIHKQFLAVLSRNGIKKMNTDGKKFDPDFHEAIAAIPSDKPEGTIIEVVLPGYIMNDKVLRHAKVTVATKMNESTVSATTSLNDSKPKFCSICGNPLEPDDKFCSKCGRKLI